MLDEGDALLDGGAVNWPGAQAWQQAMERIRADGDPGVRNLHITRMYYLLSRGMDATLGDLDANWLTFGIWASHTAGRFIRGEHVPLNWGAEHVADGNLAIIEDIAPCFVAYLAGVHAPAERHPLIEAGRQRIEASQHLHDAFACYERARLRPRDPEDALRAQWILRANIGVAYHEQWLADCFVDRAMPLGGMFGIATTRFVRLDLPHRSLDLCEPVPPPDYLDGGMWPATLERLQDAGLRGLYERIGQAPEDVDGSAARSWEEFDERMGYIAVFFRAFQRDPKLHALPGERAGYEGPAAGTGDDLTTGMPSMS